MLLAFVPCFVRLRKCRPIHQTLLQLSTFLEGVECLVQQLLLVRDYFRTFKLLHRLLDSVEISYDVLIPIPRCISFSLDFCGVDEVQRSPSLFEVLEHFDGRLRFETHQFIFNFCQPFLVDGLDDEILDNLQDPCTLGKLAKFSFVLCLLLGTYLRVVRSGSRIVARMGRDLE